MNFEDLIAKVKTCGKQKLAVAAAEDDAALLGAVVPQYYLDRELLPREILLPLPVEDMDTLSVLLTERCGHTVTLRVPQRGQRRELLDIACRNAIEDAIRQSFDGMHLDKNCITPVLEEYGYKRTAWVLANTLHELKWDGRFSYANKHWAEKIYIPTDLNHNSDFVVRSHPAVLDGFVSFYRKAVQALNLFGAEHCVGDRAEQDYTAKVLVLSPHTLKESFWSQENQLWYAHDGFGCSPHAIGRSVRCTCLGDGEMTRWNRDEFIGVLDEQFLPEWAQEKLAELTAPRQEETTTGEMKLE